MRIKPSQLFLILTVGFLASCGQQEEPVHAKPSQPTPMKLIAEPEPIEQPADPVESVPPQPETPPPIVEPEEPEQPEYAFIGRPKPFHYSNIRRFGIRIRVERDHTREEIESILEQAARATKASVGGHAIDVMAFAPGDDSSGSASVGQGVLAPNGRWADAGSSDPVAFRILFFSDVYFQPEAEKQSWQPGDQVVLQDDDGDPIRLTDRWDNWSQAHEVTSVPHGTEATILQKHIEPMGDGSALIRYEIKAVIDSKTVRGWVHREAVEGSTAP